MLPRPGSALFSNKVAEMGDEAIFFLVLVSILGLLDIMLTTLVIVLCRRTGCCPVPDDDLHQMKSIE
jgi:hypothetical protein